VVGGNVHRDGKQQDLFHCGAHAGCSSKYSLCYFDLCKCENCLIILPSCWAEARSVSSTPARVPLEVADEPCLATWHSGPRQLFSHAD